MILFKKEKEVIELILQHVDKVEECIKVGITTLQAYLKDDIQSAKQLARETDRLEGVADMIRHDVRDKLYSGAYLPLLREDIYKMVEGMDKVCNACEACCDFFLNQRPIIPDEMKQSFLIAVQESFGIIAPLRHAVMCFVKGVCPIEVTRQHSKEVGLKESNLDSIEWDVTKEIFSADISYGHKIHLKLCLDAIIRVSDRAENAADQLELTAIKSTSI